MNTYPNSSLCRRLALAVLALQVSSTPPAMAGGFVRVSPMKRARNAHSATLLPNGKVLVAGGFPVGTSAELYDPATDTWTVTGSPGTWGSPAVLLASGKVLAGAELYDPVAGTWTATGAPSNYYYTARLLLDGSVLCAGGTRRTTAERYDPARGTWSEANPLAWDRDACTATLLRNGQVLVGSGLQQGPDIAIPSAELYDPPSGTWTEIPMVEARFGHTATLLADGRVLMAGGVSLVSGRLNHVVSAEVYEPDPDDGAASWLSILHRGNGVLGFSWTGAGSLEQTESLTAPNWQRAPIQRNPQVVSTAGGMKFFRVRAE